jgi:ABC-type multidrug transport system fused ATPase/permease subunit
LMPMAKMISHGLVSVLLLALLIFVDPIMAFIVFGVLAGTYLVIFRVIRESLSRIGQERIEANRQRFTAVGEALGGIKTIKILEREARYLRRFREPSYIVARKMAATSILSQLPRYIVEAIGFGGIILIALTLTFRQSGDSVERLGSVLPLLGLYAFAGFRLLPAIQNIYQNMVSLRFAAPAVDTIAHELNEAKFMLTPSTISKGSLPIKRAITLENVTYHYPNSEGTGINEVSLVVPKGNSLGIIGTTGAGKTTLVDVILGLLVPVAGRILIDDVPITNENRRAWQDNLGYVPQDIYLTDSTVAQNIAFGLLPNEIDMTRIEDCARMARIHEFVSQELPQGYATQVGELGVRLSGGQRQRIGIARALYHDPEVIVFDEATSALDTETESEVLEAISTLSGHKTLIIIAHRLTTVEACDEVIRLVAGRVVDE